ncbi:MAG TPA: hypothetical protein VFE24_10760 [Pirellulales bacterium]|jgi:hypothetical protein|nr:hypothetical protein [Pirellulales bacterium]
MRRLIIAAAVLALSAGSALAHFAYLVPSQGKVQIVLSENLKPDEDVDIAILEQARFFARDAAGHETPLALHKQDHALESQYPEVKTALLHGSCEAGVMQRDKIKPFLIRYYPKSIVGNPLAAKTTLGGETPVELIAVGTPGALKFQALIKGKPAGKVDVTVLLPDGKSQKVVADAEGMTAAFTAPGQYAAWFKTTEPAEGEAGGEKYEEIRTYATLVITVPAP